MVLPYVIQILVTAGDPDGVRVVEKSNWTGKGIVFARSDLAVAQGEGLGSPGVYILMGDDPDEEFEQRIYVGQGDDVGRRLKQHQSDDNKEFWETTIVFLSGNQSLNRAHVSFLEAEMIRLANDAARVAVANGNQPGTPHLPAADHAVAAGFLEEMRAILPVLGLDAFESIVSTPSTEGRTRYYLDSRGGKGEGEERSDGFLVFAGATARLEQTPSLAKHGNKTRERLIATGRLKDVGKHYELTEDTLFRTPSAAAGTLIGGHVNGREAWKDGTGVTLKQRQIEEAGL